MSLAHASGWFLILGIVGITGLVVYLLPQRPKKAPGDGPATQNNDAHGHDRKTGGESHTKPAHGHGGHDEKEKDGWGFLRFSFGFLAFVCVIAFGWWLFTKVGLVGTAAPHTRGHRSIESVSTHWQKVSAPSSDSAWSNAPAIESEPGYDTILCTPSADPTCANAETQEAPIGFSAQCQLYDGTWVDWSRDACRNHETLRLRSLAHEPITLRWRYKRR